MTSLSPPRPGVPGWHPGETTLHQTLGFHPAVSARWQNIENQMREQHRIFHTSNLPFIPITVIDEEGRPWASIAAGKTGEIGFVEGPDLKTLVFKGRAWVGDPILGVFDRSKKRDGQEKWNLTAGLGIEFSTRRRNKFAGAFRSVRVDKSINKDGLEYVAEVEVNEAVGNCPKYINVRQLDPYPHTNPRIAYQVPQMHATDQLPPDVLSIINKADTVFIATVSSPTIATSTSPAFPAHAGMNARGGLPGFIRVRPSDSRTIILPDYSGNRFMSSLGNIESSGLAGFTIVDFETGDILYLTGTAKNLIGAPALELMSRHASLTVLETTGYSLIRDALPVRQRIKTTVARSPYSPKVKYLNEEAAAQSDLSAGHKAHLNSAVQLSDDLAVFRFAVVSKSGAPALRIRPGQAIVLDFMDWLGPPAYKHMADSAPGSINDDRVRTWTVSSAHEGGDVTEFELTMREMKGGAVTGALFDILREQPENERGGRVSFTRKPVVAEIVGVTGDFVLDDNEINVFWVAGGIGITPFLAMLDALGTRGEETRGDIVLALSTREPDLLLEVLRTLLEKIPGSVAVRIDLFTRAPVGVGNGDLQAQNVKVSIHKGRIGPDYWTTISNDRDVLICGPNEFGDSAVEGLRAAGVPNGKIHREGFY
ncbi:hypothetical protein BJX70DRAFT_352033 [Aspergillus crustosus]